MEQSKFDENKIKPLTPREVEFISRHKERIYKFDFSKINEKTFDSLLLFLQNEFKYGIEGIGFTNDLLLETIRKLERQQAIAPFEDIESSFSYELDHSVAKNRRNYVSQLIEMLEIFMQNSNTFSFIKFRFISIPHEDIDCLSKAIFNCSTLRVVKLCDVPIGDFQFSKLCKSLCRGNINEIQFRKCCLTDSCANDVKKLLEFHSFIK